ncbi:MAG: LPS export ABC transporter periplasmic protein LptC [Endomicrobium sp.]|nr:LPS export ABC transporter periplasmic protein LptC [Endomicrobium sp.]
MSFFKKSALLFMVLCLGCKDGNLVVSKTPSIYEHCIDGFVLTQTKDGRLKMILESESAIINEYENIAYLKFPIVKFYDKGVHVSTFTMENANISMKTYDINGKGKCSIDTVNNEHLQTSDLIYNASKKMVYSDSDVKIIKPGVVFYGTSFESDAKLDKVVIKNQRIVLD